MGHEYREDRILLQSADLFERRASRPLANLSSAIFILHQTSSRPSACNLSIINYSLSSTSHSQPSACSLPVTSYNPPVAVSQPSIIGPQPPSILGILASQVAPAGVEEPKSYLFETVVYFIFD